MLSLPSWAGLSRDKYKDSGKKMKKKKRKQHQDEKKKGQSTLQHQPGLQTIVGAAMRRRRCDEGKS